MEFFIVFEQQIIKLKKTPQENTDLFLKRIEFLITALELKFSLSRAQTLSYSYSNKIQTNVTYIDEIESNIQMIVNKINDKVIII